MESTKQFGPTQIETPIEIICPVPGTIDHKLTLAHDMRGNRLHYVHEVSFEDGNEEAAEYLAKAEYRFHVGWIRKSDSKQMWTMQKTYGLSVENW